MSLVPNRFLFRWKFAAPYVAKLGKADDLDLPESARLDSWGDLDESPSFADVRLGWNMGGLGITVAVVGKSEYAIGNPKFPRAGDGVSVWVDTRSDRTGHRATRTCHQWDFLPNQGDEGPEPIVVASKINRALQDPPAFGVTDILFQFERDKRGYAFSAFLPASVLNAFDPEEFPQIGFCYSIRDRELGVQTLGHSDEFPYWEDPSLWATVDLLPA